MRKSVVYIKPFDSSFVKKDESFLQREFGVKSFTIKHKKGLNVIHEQLILFFKLLTAVPRSDLVFVWFADFYSFFPILLARIFRKRSILILGGYDVYCLPELNYGYCDHPVRNFCAKFSIKKASIVLPVAEAMRKELLQKKWGKKISGKLRSLPTGYDPEKWYCDTEKEDIVLTVAAFSTLKRVKIKGLDLFIEVAKLIPELTFQIVGNSDDSLDLFGDPPDNVELLGIKSPEELRKLYSAAKVFALFSRTEGLPNALCEAMFCECIPVGSKVGGIPELINDFGTIIEDRNPEKIAEVIRLAIADKTKDPKKIRNFVSQKYHISKREDALRAYITNNYE